MRITYLAFSHLLASSFIADFPVDYIFHHPPSVIASLLTDWIVAGIDTFIPSKKFQQRPNSPS